MERSDYCPELPLAIASVPIQPFERLFTPDTALEKGTMFQALCLDFDPKEAGCNDE